MKEILIELIDDCIYVKKIMLVQEQKVNAVREQNYKLASKFRTKETDLYSKLLSIEQLEEMKVKLSKD